MIWILTLFCYEIELCFSMNILHLDIEIPIIKIRRSHNRLNFMILISIPVNGILYCKIPWAARTNYTVAVLWYHITVLSGKYTCMVTISDCLAGRLYECVHYERGPWGWGSWPCQGTHSNTVYPKKYAHGFCFAVLCCGYTLPDFPISIRLTSLALWQSNDCPSASKANLMNMDKYFMWIHYERLHNHNKAKHNKTVCIFLGIYCTLLPIECACGFVWFYIL